MPFGLKNASATYQRLVHKMFANHISKTMKLKVDDMLVKSLQTLDYLAHFEKMLSILQRYKMKLNSSTCSFSVSSKKL